MKVSVLVTTYNGAKYILEQLQSILDQTRKPDEVVITDDCSSDDTVELVRGFIIKNKLYDDWKVITNIKNVGFLQNSHQGAMNTTGDIIFWSDQDDVWFQTKVEKMAEAMEDNIKILALSCNYIIVDDKLNRIGHHVSLRHNINVLAEKSLKYVFISRAIAAQSLAVRKSLYLDLVSKYKNPYYFFDVIIVTYAAALHGYYLLNQELTLYRQHNNNTSKYIFSLSNLIDSKYDRKKAIYAQLKMLLAKKVVLKNKITVSEMKEINKAIIITKLRFKYVSQNSLIHTFLLLFSIGAYINKKWIIADLICMFFNLFKK